MKVKEPGHSPSRMKTMKRVPTATVVIALIALDLVAAWLTGADGWLTAPGAGALLLFGIGHCDGVDGPVVSLARRALDAGNVNLVLPWVRAQDEAEIREGFAHATAVRKLGGEAKALADRHFFETLVRVHRAGEGAPYTGLKPAGRDLGPAIPAADRALEDGSIDRVLKLLNDGVRKGLHEHFHRAVARKRFDVNDVPAGREYVEAYVPYIHYVERLWLAATSGAHGHHEEPHSEHAAHPH
jgi:Family of unknown function (DUF6448)